MAARRESPDEVTWQLDLDMSEGAELLFGTIDDGSIVITVDRDQPPWQAAVVDVNLVGPQVVGEAHLELDRLTAP